MALLGKTVDFLDLLTLNQTLIFPPPPKDCEKDELYSNNKIGSIGKLVLTLYAASL